MTKHIFEDMIKNGYKFCIVFKGLQSKGGYSSCSPYVKCTKDNIITRGEYITILLNQKRCVDIVELNPEKVNIPYENILMIYELN
jgi:hypothetical protein